MKAKVTKCFYMLMVFLLLILAACVSTLLFMLISRYPLGHLIIGGLFTLLVGVGIVVSLVVVAAEC